MTLVVLVGPKGSGKTHIGTVLEARLGGRFIRVEPVFKALNNRPEAFVEVEREIRAALAEVPVVAVEPTGAVRNSSGLSGSASSRFGWCGFTPRRRRALGGSRAVTPRLRSR